MQNYSLSFIAIKATLVITAVATLKCIQNHVCAGSYGEKQSKADWARTLSLSHAVALVRKENYSSVAANKLNGGNSAGVSDALIRYACS